MEKSLEPSCTASTGTDDVKLLSASVGGQHFTFSNTDNAVRLDHKIRRGREENRLVRKLDIRLLPVIALIFLLNYIDRNAVTTARLQGLEKDLNLKGIQYQTVIAVLYVSYAPAQIPSHISPPQLNVMRPSLYIGSCVVLWGVISALTGLTRSFRGIIACRICLGLPEARFHLQDTVELTESLFLCKAAFLPGTMYLLSRWYTRQELAFRSSILYSAVYDFLITKCIQQLMAAGILSTMEGKLFFIEGSITVFIGFQVMWILPDYPNNTRWLSSEERLLAQARIAEDAGEADQDTAEDTAFSGLKMAIKDYRVIIFALMGAAVQVSGSFINFFPTLTATLGFNTTTTLLLVAPPWLFAAFICVINALHADKTGERFFHTVGPWWVNLVGYIIALSTSNVGARYFSTFLMAISYCSLPLVWVANTVPRPPAKRAAAIGIVNGVTNIGNLAGTYAWNAKWGPEYHTSMEVGLAAIVVSSTLAFVMRTLLVRKNRQLDEDEVGALQEANRERIQEAARLENITLEEALHKKKGFRYLY
ncbi:MFS general substrate transporter [Rickenella mellea]|uniref:MFS general substrate transporter n=1 Tax=Rickenella mellea TaxID=50990 RepID=A0A4Y7PIF7_9AGAM|nr:MFS general substrate transporter [Rickenella mellea]